MTPLPVIDLLNNVRVLSNYLYASQQVQLNSFVEDSNPTLATDFVDWQSNIDSEYFDGFLAEILLAQPAAIQQYYDDGVEPAIIQQLAQATLTLPGNTTPTLIAAADAVSNLVVSGGTFVTQLTDLAKTIEGADQKQVDDLMAQADQLSKQFDSEEQQIVEDSFKIAEGIVVTSIDIAIAVGTEGEDLQPVIKSISQVAEDAVNAITLTDEAKNTIAELQQAWAALDAATSNLAHIKTIINRLNAVTQQTSDAMTALNNVTNEWQQVVDLVNVSAADWLSYGNAALKEWLARMTVVNFATATQHVAQLALSKA